MTTGNHEIKLFDYRHHCNRLLFRGYLPPGAIIEIRCPKCGKMYKEDKRAELNGDIIVESERTGDGVV